MTAAHNPAVSSGYRPPSRPPVGRWAKHLHEQRKLRGWSQTGAFEELHEGLGLSPKSRASYIALDMGDRPPNPDEERYLISVFGEPPEDTEPQSAPPSADQAALIAALTRQAESNERLAAAIEAQARSQAELAVEIRRAALSVTGSVEQQAELLGLVAAHVGLELPQTDDEPVDAHTHRP